MTQRILRIPEKKGKQHFDLKLLNENACRTLDFIISFVCFSPQGGFRGAEGATALPFAE